MSSPPHLVQEDLEVPAVKNDHMNDNHCLYSKLKPILSFEETRQLILTKAYVFRVGNFKNLSAILSTVVRASPLNSLSHLKRVKKVSGHCAAILVGTVLDVDGLDEQHQSLLKSLNLAWHVELVPMYQSYGFEQLKEWNCFWPTIFKVHVFSTPSPETIWNDQMAARLNQVIGEIQFGDFEKKNITCCIILDRNNHVITRTYDTLERRRVLLHSVIMAINSISELQKKIDSQNSDEYLCTGYTAVLSREPCVMCSMALLHSRIKSVVYLKSNIESGALGSKFKIHCNKHLNHHFHVYQYCAVDKNCVCE